MFLEMLDSQANMLADEYKGKFEFEKVATFHFNIKILKAIYQDLFKTTIYNYNMLNLFNLHKLEYNYQALAKRFVMDEIYGYGFIPKNTH